MRHLKYYLRLEWGALFTDVRETLLRKRLRALPMTLCAVALIAALQAVQRTGHGAGLVEDLGTVRAGIPFWETLLRTPLSLFVPAPGLPVWGALAQVLLVFGIAEATIGRARTLAIAYAATLAGTSYARYALAVGPHGFLSLPAELVRVRDTGPSAAVVALAVYVALRYGAWCTAIAVVLFMVAEAVCVRNLAGYEHCAAVTAVLLLCLAERLIGRLAGRARRPASPGDVGGERPSGRRAGRRA